MPNTVSPGRRALKFQPKTTDQKPEGELEPRTLEIGDVKIPLVAEIDGLQLMLFTAAMGPGYSSSQQAQAMTDLLQRAAGEHYPTLVKACASYHLEIEDIGALCAIVADSYAERPTMPVEPSSAGQTTTGSSSEASSSSEVLSGAPSEQPTSSQ